MTQPAAQPGSAAILRGDVLAKEIRSAVADRAAALREEAIVPTLALVLATDDGGALWYASSIRKAAEKEAIDCRTTDLGADASTEAIADTLATLAGDDAVHGIILQTPLPAGASADALAELIPPEKDVDGMNPLSAGRLSVGQPSFAPATAEAVLRLLTEHEIELAGTEVAMVGRSAVVGKPAVQLLLRENATVTVCHSKTRDLAAVTARADVVVVAIGRARFLTGEFVKPGATVIDVGTNADPDGSLVGDVDAESVSAVAGALTPVPGGVGPVTTALLLQHTVQAASDAAANPR